MTHALILERAVFSACKRYRYTLPRVFVPLEKVKRICLFVMLNPSTADDERNDPTVTRAVGYAKAWGYDALLVGNAYAFRATDPDVMKAAEDPVGPDNDAHLSVMANLATLTVVAWGAHITPARSAHVLQLLRDAGADPHFLALTKGGEPMHPLYQRSTLLPKKMVKAPL